MCLLLRMAGQVSSAKAPERHSSSNSFLHVERINQIFEKKTKKKKKRKKKGLIRLKKLPHKFYLIPQIGKISFLIHPKLWATFSFKMVKADY